MIEILTRADASTINKSEMIELVCRGGHRTRHLLARILRRNDGWCGKCGADLNYEPVVPAEAESTDTHAASHLHLVMAEALPDIVQ